MVTLKTGGLLFKKLSVLCVVLTTAVVLPTSPAQAKGPLTMTVDVGYGGFHRPGSPVPLTVVLKSTRAASGDLEVMVTRDGQRDLQKFSFEITGGGRKRFDLLAPSPTGEHREILVRARDGKEVFARQKVAVTTSSDVLVGVLGTEVPAALTSVDLVPTGKRPLAFRVDPERAMLGTPALQPLSHLVVPLEGTKGLAPAIGSAIGGWVSTGGRLIIVGSGSAEGLDWLPPAWRPGEGPAIASSAAGLGEVVTVAMDATQAALDPSVWRQVIRPVISETTSVGGEQSAAFELANRLTRPRQGRVDLDAFFLFVLVYLVLVAPVNYLILKRRGRRELAWVTIPLLAVIFSGVAYGFARTDTDLSRVNQASVSLLADGAGVTSQLVALGAAARSDVQVYFPTRYAHAVASFGGSRVGKTRTVSVSGKGTTVDLETAPFSVSAAIGGGERIRGHLEARLVWDGDGFFGTVTNRTRYRLEEVRLSSGPDTASVGDLKPGQSVDVALVPGTGSDSSQFDDRFGGGARDMVLLDGTGEGTVTDLLRKLLVEEFPIDRGAVLVMGIARTEGPIVKVSGARGRTSKTALVGSVAEVRSGRDAKRLPPSAAHWWLAGLERGAAMDHGGCFSPLCAQPGVLSLRGSKEATFGSKLPPGIEPSRLGKGAVTIGTNQGVLRGGAMGAVFEQGGRAFRPIPVPQPVVPNERGEAIETVPIPPDDGTAPPDPAATYRLLYWDWVKMAWVEGEVWPGGKDPVPATAVSALGEMYVKVIAPFEISLDVATAGIEWEVI